MKKMFLGSLFLVFLLVAASSALAVFDEELLRVYYDLGDENGLDLVFRGSSTDGTQLQIGVENVDLPTAGDKLTEIDNAIRINPEDVEEINNIVGQMTFDEDGIGDWGGGEIGEGPSFTSLAEMTLKRPIAGVATTTASSSASTKFGDDGTGYEAEVSVVPEFSTYGMLAGLVVIAVAVFLFLKKKNKQ